jgi:hypothetical protein
MRHNRSIWPRSTTSSGFEMERLLGSLSKVIRSDAIAAWFDTPNPAFERLLPAALHGRQQLG